MTRTIGLDLDRIRPGRDTLLWAGLLVNTEIILTVVYLLAADVTIEEWRFLVYPFVWLNVAIWALVRTDPTPRSSRDRYLGAGIAVGYFLALAYAGGLVAPPGHAAMGWRLAWLPPGWGPALMFTGESFKLTLMPYNLVGYAALAYLVYATVLDAAGSAISGALGLLSCVSCTWPVFAGLLTSVAGAGSAIATVANEWSYAISTVVFVLTVGLLSWRPTFGR
ncbi:hypothetical protein NGM10_03140 [Halorussus salilacus]|uniref:DUF7546 family protein n=1 Tax=Halorussus salilacus TaxID=2953750 RepID=UPI00209F2A22|nr:hypothetical protein [Halorussus salilacus]USZ68741.1 hypothetical protein NGM10_03140 [Halorussus salilacus]